VPETEARNRGRFFDTQKPIHQSIKSPPPLSPCHLIPPTAARPAPVLVDPWTWLRASPMRSRPSRCCRSRLGRSPRPSPLSNPTGVVPEPRSLVVRAREAALVALPVVAAPRLQVHRLPHDELSSDARRGRQKGRPHKAPPVVRQGPLPAGGHCHHLPRHPLLRHRCPVAQVEGG
jgi:hypothetical protein